MNAHTADDGVAEVIGFILIIALIVAVAAVWILVYIPSQGNAVETEHARVVTEEIADIKYGIDLLWTTEQTGINVSRVLSPSPVEGTELSGLLFLSPPVGTGTITVSNGTAFWINQTLPTGSTQTAVSALKITYNSANYYAPDIRIVYDGGAVFRGKKNAAPYVFLPPSAGSSDLVLVTVPSNYGEQQILGNIPLSLTYKYLDYEIYPDATVALYQPDPDNPWNDFVGTFDTVTVVKYEVAAGGPQ
ncbi:hypothetical protein Mlab_1471 [Methanocorpusculum labreanum Z]|uniref:Uncharacterized protein n=1 Tax=Methanocorpusculum labreanum (strain ATCC 43576 / DSM 4855 / Z) TaxID=410358 RepID=A2STI0_METLZ|nr:hypothetical protein [Methanocorpusculum labreanum]ABN07636.1 hypothetical protein Mlab_1471 [Methanocorpusculum labreanum Z]